MRRLAKAYRLKLRPTKAHAAALARHAGACRWLWNHLLDLQKRTHADTGKFVFRFEMQKLLPGLKKDHPWLAEAPGHSLQRVCRNLDLAMKKCFREKAGFPRFKARGVAKESFYCSNEQISVGEVWVRLPKVGKVRFRSGRRPEGRMLSATVSSDGDAWWCTVQCEVEADASPMPVGTEVLGVDLGLRDLAVLSDGSRIAAPRGLRKAQRRLRRAQRRLARRAKASANRDKAKAAVRRLHRKVANRRSDFAHKLTSGLVAKSAVLVTEDLNVKAMSRGLRLGMSVGDAGMGEVLRQVRYKADWAGVVHVEADRFFPSTQTCSSCGTVKAGAERLGLSRRTFRCGCGAVLDRDHNAALNLRRLGLEALEAGRPIMLYDVGQAMPERAGGQPHVDACGDPSAGPIAQADGRYGSAKQESSASNLV